MGRDEPNRDREGADERKSLMLLQTASLRARLGLPIDSGVSQH